MLEVKKIIFVLVVLTTIVGVASWKTDVFDKLLSSSGSKSQPVFNKKHYSLDDPKSIWVIVNKTRQLETSSYVPGDLVQPEVSLRKGSGSSEMKLRKSAASAIEKLFAAAEKSDFKLALASGYRSYALQVQTYNSEVKAFGQKIADKESARPGYSEHQTGWAADIGPTSGKCVVLACFADTPEGKWLAANAHRFGFIIRYPKGLENIVGYAFEPWHLRYVGNDLAAEVNKSDQTLEEFFNLPFAPDYK